MKRVVIETQLATQRPLPTDGRPIVENVKAGAKHSLLDPDIDR
jgi:hypothetical protein